MRYLLLIRPEDHLILGVRWTGCIPDGTGMLTAGDGARLTVMFPPQHVGEECSPPFSPAPVTLAAGTTGALVPGWRGVLAGPSRIVVAVPPGRRIALTVTGILEAVDAAPLVVDPGETAIEMPWRTILVPGGAGPGPRRVDARADDAWLSDAPRIAANRRNGRGASRSGNGTVVCRHTGATGPDGVHGVWRTRLVDAETTEVVTLSDARLGVRVVDHDIADTLDPDFGANTLGTPRAVRTRLVAETATSPASASRLELSALGGTLHAKGTWAAFEWEQRVVLGRDMLVRARFEGVLYPLGHRAEYLEVVTREFDLSTGGAAVLRRIGVLTVREPVRGPAEEPELRRRFPLGTVEIARTIFTDLESPNTGTGWQFTGLPGVGEQATHFQPTTTAGLPVLFPVRCVTATGVVSFDVPLLFVTEIALGAGTSLTDPGLAQRLRDDYGTVTVSIAPTPLDLTGAGGRGRGDIHEVHGLTLAGLAQQRLTDGYRAGLDRLDIALPALRVLRGDDRLTPVRLAENFLRDGTADIVLEMLPDQAREIDFGGDAARSGGLLTPKYVTDAISRTLGPVNLRALPDPATGLIDPAALFPSDQAALLGFPLRTLVTQLRLPPEITAVPRTGAPPEVRMNWRDVALRSVGTFVAGPGTRLDLTVVAAPDHHETRCTVEEFTLELPPGSKRVLRLSFAALTFTQRGSNAPEVALDGLRVEFVGALNLLKELQDLVRLGDTGKMLDISTRGITVRYALPLPPVTAGAFVMRNIALTSAVDIPFDGRPVGFTFGFASRANPFQLAVMMFGGGGYLELELDRDGLRRFEAALEFGAFVAVDFVVASGEVHALGGVRFTLEADGAVTLCGYLRIGGCVEVLGLISVSIELCLSLTYRSERNALVGRATLVIEVDLTLWSDSVEIDSGEWVLAGGAARRPAVRDRDAAMARWLEYRAAFAGVGQ
ncbi:hypothetical protein [Nocardia caishijiensis]|uniref:Uncharacterized protein n=1 Tax=Nocardia caishijiensis TaxID=184756 RepID=A0ABQ6YM11_9NOCA|nr:hypothetical protein [Nocardia caishijiensis]KAF0846825.1 hypothetical protein FNL39_104247 [Nocardia caishijiensis]